MGQLWDDAIVETAARKIISWMEFGINEAVMSHLHLEYSALYEQNMVAQRENTG